MPKGVFQIMPQPAQPQILAAPASRLRQLESSAYSLASVLQWRRKALAALLRTGVRAFRAGVPNSLLRH